MSETVLFEADLQAGDVAGVQKQIEFAIASARARGGRLLKLRHSAALAAAARRYLRKLRGENRLRFFVAGESYSEHDAGSVYLAENFSGMSDDPDLSARNPDVTVIAL